MRTSWQKNWMASEQKITQVTTSFAQDRTRGAKLCDKNGNEHRAIGIEQ
jgi:hypothetical protein